MEDQGSVPRNYINSALSPYKPCLRSTKFVFNGCLGHLNIQVL
jgi:hypothetical protein